MAIWVNEHDVAAARKRSISRDGTLYGIWAANYGYLRVSATSAKPAPAETDKLGLEQAEIARFLDDRSSVDKMVELQALTRERGQEILAALAFERSTVIGDDLLTSKYAAALLKRSFALTFKNADIVRLLAQTGEFAKQPVQRIYDTVTMMVPILDDNGGSGPAGTRCLAAAYRLGVQHRNHQTNHSDSLSVNQVSLAYTLLTFSYTPFLPLPSSGKAERSTVELRNRFLRYWRVVGSMLGIEDGGLPADVAEAGRLFALLEGSAAITETAYGGVAYEAARALFGIYVAAFSNEGTPSPEVHKYTNDLVERWPPPPTEEKPA